MTLVLDGLIPPSADGRIPGAGQLGLAGPLLSESSIPVPNARSSALAVLDAVSRARGGFSELDRESRQSALELIERQHPEEFAALVRAAYMHYYSRPDVRPHFGVGSGPVHPEGYGVAPEPPELMEELVAPVGARGPCYRGAQSRNTIGLARSSLARELPAQPLRGRCSTHA